MGGKGHVVYVTVDFRLKCHKPLPAENNTPVIPEAGNINAKDLGAMLISSAL